MRQQRATQTLVQINYIEEFKRLLLSARGVTSQFFSTTEDAQLQKVLLILLQHALVVLIGAPYYF